MNVFVLEDQEERVKVFERIYGGDNLHIARTAMEATELLSSFYDYEAQEWSFTWDYVFLDHDLGYDEDRSDFDEGTGMEVAKYIVQTRPKIAQIIIHSWNPSGSRRMLHGLVSAGYDVDRRVFSATWK